MTLARKPAYINNKDLLKEIHLSKASYSSYLTAEDHQYDVIINDIADLNEENIQIAREKRAKRLLIKIDDVLLEDLVFRIMTFDHIVLAPGRKKNPKTIADHHIKLNFPPYQHFRIVEGIPLCVGKSHWKDGLSNGQFSKEHGRITINLAKMMMKLCDKYSMRSEWCNYSYRDDMCLAAVCQLSAVGLSFNESRSNNPFAWYTECVKNSFRSYLNDEKKQRDIRDSLIENAGMTPSFTRQFDNSDL